jgi:dTDP-glucose pyrophosphorylase/predicted transcriptional regulator
MTMKDWKNTIIGPDTPILEAMRIIDESSMAISLVINAEQHLIGVITDGDIRRGILRGVTLDQPVHLVMSRQFTSVPVGTSHAEILNLMKLKGLRQIPEVDDRGRVVGLKILADLIEPVRRDNWVVLMAGGLGTRLRPLTDTCPKPLLKVGDKPLLKTILENFIAHDFHKFYISVHYKAEMIENYLGDGSRWGININYLREAERLGTAGALGLLPDKPVHSVIVMNGDVLSNVNFQHLLDFHQSHKAKATMCVWDYHVKVPYGVIKTDQHRLTGIDEKPIQQFFVNAGIYVLEPDVLDFIPKNTQWDMPDLFALLINKGYETIAFPIREYWMDIGRVDDFIQANGEYHEVFDK